MINTLYLKHVDGLRALAVLSVLFVHLNFSLFSGGYIGVDIFFVISGFLITRLILSEIEMTGSFCFIRFYCRRVKRILPALFFVLILSWVLGFLLFSPQHFKQLGGSILFASLSSSNFYFWAQSGYFDLASQLKPLLHTWSLGVEEQFYFIWPALLYFGALKHSKKYLPVLILSVFFMSLLLNLLCQKTHVEALYYLMPFRMFELCVGALMVWIVQYEINNKLFIELLCVMGIVMMLYPAIHYTDNTLFPSYNALMPIIGAALVIYAGKAKYVGRVFTNKIAIGIGLISYSLYLIHWPLIVFYSYYTSTPLSTEEKIILLLCSLLIATLMYFFIEQPFRRKPISAAGQQNGSVPSSTGASGAP